MCGKSPDSTAVSQRVDRAIAAYLHLEDAGHAPDPQEFISRHQDLADELALLFANREQFDRLAETLRPVRSATIWDAIWLAIPSKPRVSTYWIV